MRVYLRAEWGARYSNGAVDADGDPIILRLPFAEFWMHHTAGGYLPASATVEQECAEMRRIEQTGQDRFGQGISYTWVIFPSGRVYEGHSVDRRGAHTAGRNDVARAICYPGNYSTHQLTPAQERSTAALLQHCHMSAWSTRRTFNGGHRDLKATDCPGDHAYARLGAINQLALGALIEEECMAIFDERSKAAYDEAYHVVVTGQRYEGSNLQRQLGYVVGQIRAVSAQVDKLAAKVDELAAKVDTP